MPAPTPVLVASRLRTCFHFVFSCNYHITPGPVAFQPPPGPRGLLAAGVSQVGGRERRGCQGRREPCSEVQGLTQARSGHPCLRGLGTQRPCPDPDLGQSVGSPGLRALASCLLPLKLWRGDPQTGSQPAFPSGVKLVGKGRGVATPRSGSQAENCSSSSTPLPAASGGRAPSHSTPWHPRALL